MKKKILIAAFACLATMAIAQSSTNQPASASKETKPRDLATGQASGKAASQPAAQPAKTPQANGGQSNRESSAPSVSEVVVTKSTDKADPRVATGDVNGDGRPDVAATSNTNGQNAAAINTSHSNIKNSKDVATGQASGKRQHDPITFQKEVSTSSPAK